MYRHWFQEYPSLLNLIKHVIEHLDTLLAREVNELKELHNDTIEHENDDELLPRCVELVGWAWRPKAV